VLRRTIGLGKQNPRPTAPWPDDHPPLRPSVIHQRRRVLDELEVQRIDKEHDRLVVVSTINATCCTDTIRQGCLPDRRHLAATTAEAGHRPTTRDWPLPFPLNRNVVSPRFTAGHENELSEAALVV
jgi:hypothetical protein